MTTIDRTSPFSPYTSLEHAILALPAEALEQLRADGRELLRALAACGGEQVPRGGASNTRNPAT